MRYILAFLLTCSVAFGQKVNDGKFIAVDNKIDTNNSTTSALGANNSYTGTVTDLSEHSAISVIVETDAPSATKGFNVQYSPDGVEWHTGESYTVPANSEKFYTPPVWQKYYRFIYTNGAVANTNFHIHSFLHSDTMKWSSHNVDDPIADEDDAELIINVNKARKPDGTYASIGASTDGNLLIHDAENPSAIAFGAVSGKAIIQKFGNAPDFDTGDGEVSTWDGASDAGIDNMQYDYSLTADIDSVVSSSASDIMNIEIQGLGASTNLVVQTVTMNGQTRVALATNLFRVFRMKNVGASNMVGNISCYVTNAPISSGVVDDSSLVRAHILNGNNQTEMALYTVPHGDEIVLKGLYAYSAGASRSASYLLTVWARPPGQVFQLKWKGAFNDDVDSGIRQPYETGLYFDEGTDVELRVQILTAAITAATISSGFEIEKKLK
jgi:hypothetical protein